MRSSPNAPGMPSSIARSLVPISSEAMPGTTGGCSGVFDRGRGLQHDDDEGRGIDRRAGLGQPEPLIAEMRQAAGDRTVPQRRVAQGLRDLPRLLGRIDMRHDDAEPAATEKA